MLGSRLRLAWILSLGAITLTATASPDDPPSLSVAISSPAPDQPTFGQVVFAVEVAGGTATRVDFYFQRRLVATLEAAPFRVTIDTGRENVEKRFTAVAWDDRGNRVEVTTVAPSIPVDLELELSLQQLYVTVTHDGNAILDLERNDFRVFDDGSEQRLITFERGSVPMALVLLLDASLSMAGERLSSALDAAPELLGRLDDLDQATVIVFSDRVRQVTNYPEGARAPTLAGSFSATGGTAINDHLYAALRLLDLRQGRPAIVLLSDGADTLSFLSIEQVDWKLRRSDAPLYRIAPGPQGREPSAFATSWRGYQENRDEVAGLERAITASGGRTLWAASGELDEAVRAVVRELRQQYVLGYYPTNPANDGSWRPVRVEVDMPGVEVRTRSGYIDR